jgi:hypothetical protein
MHLLDGLQRRPTRPIAIGRGFQVRVEDRLQDQQGGGLHHAIPDHGDSEWPLPSPTWLRHQHPPHWLGTLRLRPHRLPHGGQPPLPPGCLDVLERYAVHARRPPVLLAERVGARYTLSYSRSKR